MRKIYARITCLITLMLMVFAMGHTAAAQVSYPAYNYNVYGESVPVPPAHDVSFVMDGQKLGVGSLNNASDIFVDGQDHIYILDAGNQRIIILDSNFKLKNIIGPIYSQKGNEKNNFDIANANGIFVNERDHTLWMTLGESQTIIQIDQNGKILNQLGIPKGDNVPANMFFKPSKIAIGSDDTLYVVSEGVFQGIIEMDQKGKFLGFFGSNKVDVTLSVITEVFWKKFFSTFSDKAADTMLKIVPIEYSSIDMNEKGFIYAVTGQSMNSMYEIKKLNPKGNNIMRVKSRNDVSAGVVLNIGDYGDIEYTYDKGTKIDTKFIDLNVDSKGFINALDMQRGRVFQYDNESNLIGIFGANGSSIGTFTNPVAVESVGDHVLVLDKGSSEITVFKPTLFGDTVRKAILMFNEGLYSQSEDLWRNVLRQSTNYELAYVGISKALYSREEYSQAMKYAKLGYDKKMYDEAYTQLRKDFLRHNFIHSCVIAFAGLLLLYILVKVGKKYHVVRRMIPNKRYLPITYYIFHPFKAADDIRAEGMGDIKHSFVLVLLLFITRVLSLGLSGFLFNNVRLELISVSREFFIVFGLYAIFIVANWAVCTLTGGEGRWRDITIIAAYSLIPMILANGMNIFLSNVLTLREGVFMSLITGVGFYWFLFLMFVGITTIHRYSPGMAVWSGTLSVLGMLFIVFLGVLVYSLFSQMMVFFGNIIIEITYRI